MVRAGLTWWQANVLRAYAKYLRQAGTTFSQGYIEHALVDNPQLAVALVELFEARFDPATRRGRLAPTTSTVAAIEEQLASVASLDQDRILRSFSGPDLCHVRTNAYRTDDERRAAAPH